MLISNLIYFADAVVHGMWLGADDAVHDVLSLHRPRSHYASPRSKRSLISLEIQRGKNVSSAVKLGLHSIPACTHVLSLSWMLIVRKDIEFVP